MNPSGMGCRMAVGVPCASAKQGREVTSSVVRMRNIQSNRRVFSSGACGILGLGFRALISGAFGSLGLGI